LAALAIASDRSVDSLTREPLHDHHRLATAATSGGRSPFNLYEQVHYKIGSVEPIARPWPIVGNGAYVCQTYGRRIRSSVWTMWAESAATYAVSIMRLIPLSDHDNRANSSMQQTP
jgi:hypothetical protein